MITAFFYAAFKAKMVVYLAVCLLIVTISLDLVLVGFLDAQGLALAHSGGMAFTTVVGYLLFKRLIGDFDWKGLATFNVKIVVASALMGLVIHNVAGWLSRTVMGMSNTLNQMFVLGLAGACGVIVFAIIALLLRVEEVHLAVSWASRKWHHTRETLC